MKLKLYDLLGQIDDPRRDLGKLHPLNDILLIGILSVLSGADTWNEMEDYARAKEEFLKTFLELPYGIPSHDTFNRVFSSIDSTQFEQVFVQWVNSLAEIKQGQVISIDGKTIRGAKEHGKKSLIHMISAWANANNMVLGQIKTDVKSNEITAIPKLLDVLEIEKTIISIDAMGTQKNIADKIIEKDADYILAVKENQPNLLEQIIDEFRFYKPAFVDINEDIGHGRIEKRVCSVITDFQFIEENNQWKGLKSIIKIESTREFKNSDRKTEEAVRYYISSLTNNAELFQKQIRSHWGIENKLHWILDVAFREDASRKRKDNAAQNFSILNKIALNLLKNEKTAKLGVKGKRLKAGWDNQYLLKVLNL